MNTYRHTLLGFYSGTCSVHVMALFLGLVHIVVSSSMDSMEQGRSSHVILASYVNIASMVDREDLMELMTARIQVGSTE